MPLEVFHVWDFPTVSTVQQQLVGQVHIEFASYQWRTQEIFSGRVQQIQLRTERTGIWGGGSLVRGSGGSCNLVQEISFHIVKFS